MASFKPEVCYGSGAAMSEVASGCANLILSGPPYYPDSMEAVLQTRLADLQQREALGQEILHYANTLRPVFKECERILASDGALILQTRDVRLVDTLVAVESAHRALVEATGLILYTRYQWRPQFVTHPRRTQLQSAAARAMPRAFDPEIFLVFKRPGACYSGNPTDADVELLQADMIRTPKGYLATPHRHQAPVPLLEAIIRSWSPPAGLVVDCFCGGGTTLYAASRVGRRSIGYEINAEWLQLAIQNLEGCE